ncbi:outer membrane lipid asymmetry maintenance protein MlaD [Saccharibacter sp. 17.LH.SD]|uniref:outer membrane lipid asymmetry maintenance protein MlaD n=1 Tax=Saccharibacter sp. 17.LH.SD TaxID=2689393 RepID=UPI00136A0DF8|nr:outer membrane lipid asymmetry maintenance protein MlaD [Saccharibacter sp. 17.LH.SD]MXV45104.1 outer membrane lipid asymmetry maintenance protein MlaD [Saccharibacter sp. 17.LH.SD]
MALEISGGTLSTRQAWQTRLELVVGLVVAVLLAALVVLALLGRHEKSDGGYPLRASFSHIDGLTVGSDVRLAGVTIGHVVSTQIDPHDFQAQVIFTVAPNVHLPTDSGAIITSDSLLGGKYIALTPGGDTKVLQAGSAISETQGAISLEQLLSKFIFSVTDSLQKKNQDGSSSSSAGAPTAGTKLQ